MGLDLGANVNPQIAVGTDQPPLTAAANDTVQAVADHLAVTEFIIYPGANGACSDWKRWL
jgi:hypothetical protein